MILCITGYATYAQALIYTDRIIKTLVGFFVCFAGFSKDKKPFSTFPKRTDKKLYANVRLKASAGYFHLT